MNDKRFKIKVGDINQRKTHGKKTGETLYQTGGVGWVNLV
jgi:hypothetical protein